MSQDINSVVLVGRLTRDVEIRFTKGGTPVGNLSIAVNRCAKKGEEWVDEVSFFDCKRFGKQAEALAPYLIKGKLIAVVGQLEQERWEKDGQKRSKVVVNLNDIQLCSSRDGDSAPSSQTQQAPPPASAEFEDDIPF